MDNNLLKKIFIYQSKIEDFKIVKYFLYYSEIRKLTRIVLYSFESITHFCWLRSYIRREKQDWEKNYLKNSQIKELSISRKFDTLKDTLYKIWRNERIERFQESFLRWMESIHFHKGKGIRKWNRARIRIPRLNYIFLFNH